MNNGKLLMVVALLNLLVACAGRPPTAVPSADTATGSEPAPLSTAVLVESDEERTMAKVDASNSIFFELGQSELSDGEKARLQEHALRLKANPHLHVTLVGHTDNSGSPSFNIAVAERRARAVYAQLRAFGVPARQLRRYGVGGEKGRLHCQTAECRQQQRRVDLVYRQSRH